MAKNCVFYAKKYIDLKKSTPPPVLEVVTNMSCDCKAEIVLSLLCCIAILDPFKDLILAQKCVWPFTSRWPCKSFALASFITD